MKSAKRMIRENIGPDGSLKKDRFLRALMLHRNTPDRDTLLSPAQVIFGRNLRDFLPCPQARYQVHPQWILQREDREKSLAKRAVSNMERLKIGTNMSSARHISSSAKMPPPGRRRTPAYRTRYLEAAAPNAGVPAI